MTLDEALALVWKAARTLESEPVELTHALGRVLARDVVSDVDLPQILKRAGINVSRLYTVCYVPSG